MTESSADAYEKLLKQASTIFDRECCPSLLRSLIGNLVTGNRITESDDGQLLYEHMVPILTDRATYLTFRREFGFLFSHYLNDRQVKHLNDREDPLNVRAKNKARQRAARQILNDWGCSPSWKPFSHYDIAESYISRVAEDLVPTQPDRLPVLPLEALESLTMNASSPMNTISMTDNYSPDVIQMEIDYSRKLEIKLFGTVLTIETNRAFAESRLQVGWDLFRQAVDITGEAVIDFLRAEPSISGKEFDSRLNEAARILDRWRKQNVDAGVPYLPCFVKAVR